MSSWPKRTMTTRNRPGPSNDTSMTTVPSKPKDLKMAESSGKMSQGHSNLDDMAKAHTSSNALVGTINSDVKTKPSGQNLRSGKVLPARTLAPISSALSNNLLNTLQWSSMESLLITPIPNPGSNSATKGNSGIFISSSEGISEEDILATAAAVRSSPVPVKSAKKAAEKPLSPKKILPTRTATLNKIAYNPSSESASPKKHKPSHDESMLPNAVDKALSSPRKITPTRTATLNKIAYNPSSKSASPKKHKPSDDESMLPDAVEKPLSSPKKIMPARTATLKYYKSSYPYIYMGLATANPDNKIGHNPSSKSASPQKIKAADDESILPKAVEKSLSSPTIMPTRTPRRKIVYNPSSKSASPKKLKPSDDETVLPKPNETLPAKSNNARSELFDKSSDVGVKEPTHTPQSPNKKTNNEDVVKSQSRVSSADCNAEEVSNAPMEEEVRSESVKSHSNVSDHIEEHMPTSDSLSNQHLSPNLHIRDIGKPNDENSIGKKVNSYSYTIKSLHNVGPSTDGNLVTAVTQSNNNLLQDVLSDNKEFYNNNKNSHDSVFHKVIPLQDVLSDYKEFYNNNKNSHDSVFHKVILTKVPKSSDGIKVPKSSDGIKVPKSSDGTNTTGGFVSLLNVNETGEIVPDSNLQKVTITNNAFNSAGKSDTTKKSKKHREKKIINKPKTNFQRLTVGSGDGFYTWRKSSFEGKQSCHISDLDMNELMLFDVSKKSGEILHISKENFVCGTVCNSKFKPPEGGDVYDLDVCTYFCNYCIFRCMDRAEFIKHVVKHRFHCKVCSFQSFSRCKVIAHALEAHDSESNGLDNIQYCVLVQDYLSAINTIPKTKNKKMGTSSAGFAPLQRKRKLCGNLETCMKEKCPRLTDLSGNLLQKKVETKDCPKVANESHATDESENTDSNKSEGTENEIQSNTEKSNTDHSKSEDTVTSESVSGKCSPPNLPILENSVQKRKGITQESGGVVVSGTPLDQNILSDKAIDIDAVPNGRIFSKGVRQLNSSKSPKPKRIAAKRIRNRRKKKPVATKMIKMEGEGDASLLPEREQSGYSTVGLSCKICNFLTLKGCIFDIHAKMAHTDVIGMRPIHIVVNGSLAMSLGTMDSVRETEARNSHYTWAVTNTRVESIVDECKLKNDFPQTYQCQNCYGQLLDIRHMKDHLSKQHDGEIFAVKNVLRRNHAKRVLWYVLCPVSGCYKYYTDSQKYIDHTNSCAALCHNSQEKMDVDRRAINVTLLYAFNEGQKDTYNSKALYQCKYCNVRCNGMQRMVDHVNMWHSQQLPMFINRKRFNENLGKVYFCPDCSMCFSSMEFQKLHVESRCEVRGTDNYDQDDHDQEDHDQEDHDQEDQDQDQEDHNQEEQDHDQEDHIQEDHNQADHDKNQESLDNSTESNNSEAAITQDA